MLRKSVILALASLSYVAGVAHAESMTAYDMAVTSMATQHLCDLTPPNRTRNMVNRLIERAAIERDEAISATMASMAVDVSEMSEMMREKGMRDEVCAAVKERWK